MPASNSTIEIPLTRGEAVYIDEQDGDLVNHHWILMVSKSGNKYAHRDRRHGGAYMHRIILSRMIGRGLKRFEFTDHIDGNGLNNRRNNLRLASGLQNAANCRTPMNNTSGIKGVTYNKRRRKWVAQVKYNYQNIVIGYYDTKEEAKEAREIKAKELQGAFFKP